MKNGQIVIINKINKYYLQYNLQVGDFGAILEFDDDTSKVLFVNRNNLGDYAIVDCHQDDLTPTNDIIPTSSYLEIVEKLFPIIDKHKRFSISEFKEYDEIIVINDNYIEYGVHKGMIGTIMESYAIKNKWYVIFSDENGSDIASICIHEKDMAKYERNNF